MTDEDGIETLLVGIDAACAEVVDPLIESGTIPTLAELFEDGIRGPIRSQIPPWTASAWPSIYTGVNPGKHGVYGFLTYEGYDWDVVTYGDVAELSLWEILAEHGKSSVVVNVPVTAPPAPFDGALIPGYVAPEDPPTVPSDALASVRAERGEYRVYPDPERDPHEEYPEVVEMRGDAFCQLADSIDPAFGFIQFQVTDSVFHEHPNDWELVESIYAAVDQQVARLLDRYDPETVIVVSDHGMGRYDAYEFRVNEFLRRQDLLETTVDAEGMPAWLPILDERLRRTDATEAQTGDELLPRAIGMAARVGITPERAGRLLRTVGLDRVVRQHLSPSTKRAGRERVDFPASKAYMRSRIELGIRLNVEGRDPEGTVAPDEVAELKHDLIETLAEVRTPDGSPVFEAVEPAEEHYWGPYADEAVDIVTVPAEFDQFLSADLKGDLFGEPPEPWNHKLDGLFAIRGSGVSASATFDGGTIYDVAPTVLATMAIPASDRMDGDVLAPVQPVGTRTYRSPDRDTAAGSTDGVEERLEAIGYL